MVDTPSTRYQVCCIQAIKELSKYETLTSEQQKVMNQAINELPIDDDYLRIFVKKNYPENATEILKRTNQLIEDKNKAENKRKIITTPLKITNYVENVQEFYEQQPFFYDKNNFFWFWNKEIFRWEIVDETDVMNAIDNGLEITGETVTSGIKNNYLETFRRIGRQKTPKIPPKSWVQFRNDIFDWETKHTMPATHEYFCCNPIPWKLGQSTKTPEIDKLFTEWVGKEYVVTLYELLAYACIPDYPIHLVFCMIGSGRNGKSKFQALMQKFLGVMNVCSTDLDALLDSRFESFKLYKKLVCQLGETNFNVLSKTSRLKRLTGQDLYGFESKNKPCFDEYNYAKIIISTNSLPVTEDVSEGFFRRWLIIDFPNNFAEGKDILQRVPDVELENLTRKISEILPVLMERGSFTNQGSIEQRQERFVQASNPLPVFLEEFFKRDVWGFTKLKDLYNLYLLYLQMKKRRQVIRKEFSNLLALEGLGARRCHKVIDGVEIWDYFVEGVVPAYDINIIEACFKTGCALCVVSIQLPTRAEKLSETSLHFLHFSHLLDSFGNWRHADITELRDICIKHPEVSGFFQESPPEIEVAPASTENITNICGCNQQKVSQEILLDNIVRAQPDWRYEDTLNFIRNCGFCNQHSEALLTHWKACGDIFEVRPGILMGRK